MCAACAWKLCVARPSGQAPKDTSLEGRAACAEENVTP
jgi:hypothetical protein